MSEEIEPDIIGVEGVGENEDKFVSFAQPDSQIGKAWFSERDDVQALFSESTIEEEIKNLIEKLENHDPNSDASDEWTKSVNAEIRAQIEILEELKEVFES